MRTIIYLLGVMFALILLSNLPEWLSTRSVRHGSARMKKRSRIIRRTNKGLVVNGRQRLSLNNSFTHALISAPTGSGKTTAYILPNILNLDHSIICTDVKGELHTLCSGYLQQKGFDIQVIDLFSINQSLRYNPLQRLTTDIEVRKFAQMIMSMNSTSQSDLFWQQGGQMVIEMILRCLVNMKDKQYLNFANLIYIVNNINTANNCEDLEPFVFLFGRKGNNTDVIDLFNRFRLSEEKIKAGWLASAISALSHFDNEEMKRLTIRNEIDFASLRKQKTALFIKTPIGKLSSMSPIITIFYSQLFDYLLGTPIVEGDQSVFALCDEFGILRKIHGMGDIMSTIRSQRVSISLIMQTLQQLEFTYGREEAATILSNCSTHIILSGIMDSRSLDYYHTLIGVETRQEIDPISGRTTLTKRSLLNPDELRRLKRQEALLLHSHLNPIKMWMTPLYKNYRLMTKAGIRSKNGQSVATLPPVKRSQRKADELQLLNIRALRKFFRQAEPSTSVPELGTQA